MAPPWSSRSSDGWNNPKRQRTDDQGDKEKGGGKGKTFETREGDWNCPACDDLQFARNKECRKCGASKPSKASYDSEGDSGTRWDWEQAEISEDFERLRAEYLVALEDGRAREECDAIHEQLMDVRPRPPKARVGDMPGIPPQYRQTAEGKENGSRTSASGGTVEARLFIGGLPADCTEEDLREIVEQLPLKVRGSERRLLECTVRQGRGCGYIRFASEDAAAEAIEELHERQVAGWDQPLRARWAAAKGDEETSGRAAVAPAPWREDRSAADSGSRTSVDTAIAADAAASSEGRRLFIGHLEKLKEKQLEDRLWQVLKPFGHVEDLRVLAAKSVAFVIFKREKDARWAKKEMDGKHYDNLSRSQGLVVEHAVAPK